MNASTPPRAAHLAVVLPDVLVARGHTDKGGDSMRASVMLVLFDHDGAPHLLLTKRTDHLVHHAGEVALPGGRFEDGDADLLGTALRETEEEIGVSAQSLTVLGRLDDVGTMVSGFTVRPWIAYHADGRPEVVVQEDEIARVMEVPLADVLAAHRNIPAIPDASTLRYPLMGEDVWGLTARILHTFSEVVQGADR